MNIIRTLDMALPEIRERRVQQVLPRMEPSLVAREHVEEGVRKIFVLKPKENGFYRLSPEQWQLLLLFDGRSSFQEIAAKYSEISGEECSEEQVRDFSDALAATDMIHRTALESNAVLLETLEQQRKKRRKSKWGELSEVNVAAWDPDAFLGRIYPYIKFLFTPGFNLFGLVMVVIMAVIFLGHWSMIWHDTLEFYTLTDKGLVDFITVWVLFSFVAFFHETAHGCTVKHFGGGVHAMGFLLMYFMPCFFCDSTEVYLYAGKWPRIYTALAGIWIELVFCSFATVLWWATPQGLWIHNVAYMLIVITGIGVVALNINPLVKLDGYFVFSELLGVTDLKEKSTAYLSTWWKRHICGLPVEVEYVPRQRRPLFIAYAIASGVYCYLLLFVIVELVYNIAHKFSPDWAWLPATLLALKVFQSRIVASGKFMKIIYLDKKERVQAWLTPVRLGLAAAGVVFLIFAPIWPDTIAGRFAVEPTRRAVIRAEVPGRVDGVFVQEGTTVSQGTPVLMLRNLSLESEGDRARADLATATARATQAELRYASFGSAVRQRQQLQERNRVLSEQIAKLVVVSPVAGVVVTPRLHDLQDAYLKEGTEIAEVDDLSSVRVRIFIPQIALRDIRVGAPADLKLDAYIRPRRGTVLAVGPTIGAIPEGLIPKEEHYEGFRQTEYYNAVIELPSDGVLREGMPGTGKIWVGHRSLAGFGWRLLHDSVARKMW
ncbi:MAG: HlyD family efflux transporter periplasmic adaptor subunit [Terriglobales bacterium]